MDTNNNGIIPTYSLTCTVHPDMDAEDDPDKLFISGRTLSPPDAEIKPIIKEILESIARDYVCSLGKDFKQGATAQISLSLQNGLIFESCSDEKIKTVFDNGLKNVVAAIPEIEAKNDGITHIKTKEISEETKKEIYEQIKNDDFLFFDPIAYRLWDHECTKPTQVKLIILYQLPLTNGGGLTTGCLRYPHLLNDLYMCINANRLSDKAKICIVGPGLTKNKKGQTSCPQYVEILSLFPEAEFLLLDNDKDALAQMRTQFKKNKLTRYDPTMLRLRMLNDDENRFHASDKYQNLFKKMGQTLVEKALSKQDAGSMLQGIESLEPFFLKVDSKKIQIREFDINTSKFNKTDKFDIIVATMSISISFQDKIIKKFSNNYFSILEKFLDSLYINGILYVDSFFIFLLTYVYGDEGMKLGIRYLESKIGNKISFELIPLSDFILGLQGNTGIIDNISFDKKDVHSNITTSSIIAIIRKNEVINNTSAELQEIDDKFKEMLKSHEKKDNR